ncbi:hypothetical protein [uncultured Draconibacterium sp.]|uniref:hypothetical protein n=1 Tax=uncultured Draconibacterium sp. TaxID=1573823 RepID=UPI003260C718
MKRFYYSLLISLLFVYSCQTNNLDEPIEDLPNEEDNTKIEISTDTVRVGLRLAFYWDDLAENYTSEDYSFCSKYIHFCYGKGIWPFVESRLNFPEFYIDWEEGEMDTNPRTNKLVQLIRNDEQAGGEFYGVNIAREAMAGCPAGPIPIDRRILYESDVPAIRKVLKDAHQLGLLKRDDYKIIQMLEESNIFCTNERAQNIVRMMDGACLEVHHFNVHWPLDEGKIKRSEVVEGALWTLDQVNIHGDSLEYVFYYGPFIGKDCAEYTPNIFKAWLQKFWQAGLPKHNDRMIYHLNAFKHACGESRPVAPESDPYSVLGCTKWLIKELNPWIEEEE